MKITDIATLGAGDLDQYGLDLSRSVESTLIVSSSASAFEIAEHVDYHDIGLVIISDLPNTVIGYVAPDFVRNEISQYYGLGAVSFAQAITHLAEKTNAPADGFNMAEQKLFWCEKGRHFTGQNPCRAH